MSREPQWTLGVVLIGVCYRTPNRASCLPHIMRSRPVNLTKGPYFVCGKRHRPMKPLKRSSQRVHSQTETTNDIGLRFVSRRLRHSVDRGSDSRRECCICKVLEGEEVALPRAQTTAGALPAVLFDWHMLRYRRPCCPMGRR
jgi:hypothetical protein